MLYKLLLEFVDIYTFLNVFKYFNSLSCIIGTLLCVIAMFLTDVMWAAGSFVIGIGLVEGASTINFNSVRTIVLSWVVTLPAGALLSIAFLELFTNLFTY